MTELLLVTQIAFLVIMGFYLVSTRKAETEKKNAVEGNARMRAAELHKLRDISLTEPLSEKTRPKCMQDIVGQQEGISVLNAALCGKNPQHVIIYGPPGVGKTCAARLALELAKNSKDTPFAHDAKFVEMDATAIRFDERAIADPLIGSVHDPIYQGAGSYGQAGIPQPKPGAVTKAHGGVLFLDEIGELHSVQMNKLLKVMEDRRVFFESAYYSETDKNMPPYIHDVFKNGMPADFRLVGATTRRPEDIPSAIRSRCIEVFFRPLYKDELAVIAKNAAIGGGVPLEEGAAERVAEYSSSGRDAVNMIQLALGIAYANDNKIITKKDIEWIAKAGRYHKQNVLRIAKNARNGVVNALGVSSDMRGFVFDIECCAVRAKDRAGRLVLSGFAEKEEMKSQSRCLERRSTAICSAENVLAVLENLFGLPVREYDIRINALGGMMVDGPSAGLAMAVLVYSVLTQKAIPGDIAFTGEVSLTGLVRAVGGVREKTEAAARAGVHTVYIPKENSGEECELLKHAVTAGTVAEVISELFADEENISYIPECTDVVSAMAK